MHGDSEAGRLLLALDPDKYGSLSKGYSATEEEIEQVIMRAYGKQKIKGKEIGLDRGNPSARNGGSVAGVPCLAGGKGFVGQCVQNGGGG